MTATGLSPESFAKSTPASVWPARLKTPPWAALNGNTCPGFLTSFGFEFLSAKTFTVVARSSADIPVVIPTEASTETLKAVPFLSSFTKVIGGRFSLSKSSDSIGTQTTPEVFLIMKFIDSVVMRDPAIIKSPSFSLSSSSTTTTGFPFLKSSIASSIESNVIVLLFILHLHILSNIFTYLVKFDIH